MIFYLFQDLFTINKPLFLFIIFCLFQGLFTILIWLVSTSYQSSEAETTSDEAHQRSSQVKCCALTDYTFDLLKLKTLNLSTIPILIFQKINYWKSFPNRTCGGWAQNLLHQRIVFIRGTHLQVDFYINPLGLSVISSITKHLYLWDYSSSTTSSTTTPWGQVVVDWWPFWMRCLAQKEQWISLKITSLR